MDNGEWAVVIVEQDAEDVTVCAYLDEKRACIKLREKWEQDIACEVNESNRQVDFDKSHCDDNYAELWYNSGNYVIKYFVIEIATGIDLPKHVAEDTVIVLGNKLNFGTIIPEIMWCEPGGEIVRRHNSKVIAIGEQFIVMINEKTGLIKVQIENIKEIIINQ